MVDSDGLRLWLHAGEEREREIRVFDIISNISPDSTTSHKSGLKPQHETTYGAFRDDSL